VAAVIVQQPNDEPMDEWMRAALAGDRATFERLHCGRLSRRITRELPSASRQPASVDDLLQQTLVQGDPRHWRPQIALTRGLCRTLAQ
jgi:hypothetical protein